MIAAVDARALLNGFLAQAQGYVRLDKVEYTGNSEAPFEVTFQETGKGDNFCQWDPKEQP